TLTQGSSKIMLGKLESIAAEILHLRDSYEIILVSSGAIAAARQYVALHQGVDIPAKQALAAIGQVHLMRLYQEVFADYGLRTSQCLLSYMDFHQEQSQGNIRSTIETLLQFGYTPIINENDTVATDEIQFGDNDKLAALTAVLVEADLLILATDTDGLFTSDPKLNPDAEIVTEVTAVESWILRTEDTKSTQGSGGMKSKLQAAHIAQQGGVETWILSGRSSQFVSEALAGRSVFTKVIANESKKL
ncbi:MAG: glutamate 5-kinase, partial [Bacteroidota bacterium]